MTISSYILAKVPYAVAGAVACQTALSIARPLSPKIALAAKDFAVARTTSTALTCIWTASRLFSFEDGINQFLPTRFTCNLKTPYQKWQFYNSLFVLEGMAFVGLGAFATYKLHTYFTDRWTLDYKKEQLACKMKEREEAPNPEQLPIPSLEDIEVPFAFDTPMSLDVEKAAFWTQAVACFTMAALVKEQRTLFLCLAGMQVVSASALSTWRWIQIKLEVTRLNLTGFTEPYQAPIEAEMQIPLYTSKSNLQAEAAGVVLFDATQFGREEGSTNLTAQTSSLIAVYKDETPLTDDQSDALKALLGTHDSSDGFVTALSERNKDAQDPLYELKPEFFDVETISEGSNVQVANESRVKKGQSLAKLNQSCSICFDTEQDGKTFYRACDKAHNLCLSCLAQNVKTSGLRIRQALDQLERLGPETIQRIKDGFRLDGEWEMPEDAQQTCPTCRSIDPLSRTLFRVKDFPFHDRFGIVHTETYVPDIKWFRWGEMEPQVTGNIQLQAPEFEQGQDSLVLFYTEQGLAQVPADQLPKEFSPISKKTVGEKLMLTVTPSYWNALVDPENRQFLPQTWELHVLTQNDHGVFESSSQLRNLSDLETVSAEAILSEILSAYEALYPIHEKEMERIKALEEYPKESEGLSQEALEELWNEQDAFIDANENPTIGLAFKAAAAEFNSFVNNFFKRYCEANPTSGLVAEDALDQFDTFDDLPGDALLISASGTLVKSDTTIAGVLGMGRAKKSIAPRTYQIGQTALAILEFISGR